MIEEGTNSLFSRLPQRRFAPISPRWIRDLGGFACPFLLPQMRRQKRPRRIRPIM